MKFLARTIVILLFLPLFCVSRFAQGQSWKLLTQMPVVVNSGYFFDESHGLIGLGHTTVSVPIGIYRTSDGGQTWNQCSTPSNYSGSVSSIFMTDSKNGWASILPWQSLGTTRLWRTIDGGLTWTENSSVGRGTGDCVYQTKAALILSDLDPGVMGGVSTDDGHSFSPLFPGRTTGIDFVNDSVGIVTVFREGPWQKTTDAGLTWQALSIAEEAWSVYAVKGTSRFYVGGETNHTSRGDVTIVRETTDYGDDWSDVDTLAFQTTGDIKGAGDALYLQTDNESNLTSGILRSTDRGRSWTDIGGPQNWFDSRFVALSGGCGDAVIYAFDGVGGVYKYIDDSHGAFTGATASMHTIIVPQVPINSQASLPFSVDFSRSFNVDSISSLASELNYQILFDDTVVAFQSISPPAGWNLKGLALNGGTINVTLVRLPNGKLSSPGLIGNITFKAITQHPQTTSFLLTSIGFKGPWGNRNICLTAGEGFFWGMRIVESNGVSSILAAGTRMTVFPNPIEGRFAIQIFSQNEGVGRLEVTDLLGRTVLPSRTLHLNNTTSEVSIDANALSAGVYQASLTILGERFAVRFVKN
jgi:hypothetical protein